jgi:hypothetical protein
MRNFIAFLAAAALAAALTPAVAGAQAPPETAVPAPKPIVTKLGRTPVVQLAGDAGGLPFLGATAPYNAGDWENALRKYHDDHVYDAQLAQIGALADRHIKRFSFRHHRRGHRGGHGRRHGHKARTRIHNRKLAIVLDIDETTLSNYTAIEKDNFTFGTNSQNEAVDQIGTAIAPTKTLFDDAKQRGIAVFFITGRGEAVRTPTEQNLAREGFDGYQQLVLKPADFHGTTVEYKSGARAAIEDQGYKIIANVGDQYSDLAGGHTVLAFKYANPFYFLP